MPGDKQPILRKAKEEFDSWENLIAALSEAQLTARQLAGGWSIQDGLAHLLAVGKYPWWKDYALAYVLTACDACYAVLAQQLGIPLVTADALVAEAVPWAVWYEDMVSLRPSSGQLLERNCSINSSGRLSRPAGAL
jgi:hypothetical protein